ncbi:MAG: efflux RND transporter periplasmic adaptor subunit [Pirellulales bacterium]
MLPATSPPRTLRNRVLRWLVPVLAIAALTTSVLVYPKVYSDGLSRIRPFIDRYRSSGGDRSPPDTTSADLAQNHAEHGHAEHGHAEHHGTDSLVLSEQARKNIGLRVAEVQLGVFVKTISVPGMVAERPGQSTILVTAPMTGTITRIHVIEGEAIEPGRPLFEMRLTHEELVQSQAELLQTAEELDVTAREIKRIERLTESGGLAGKQLLERQYERQKLEAILRSKREALLLHGLNEAQIDTILEKRQLLKELTVAAPQHVGEKPSEMRPAPYQVQSIKVAPGQHVNAGDTLLMLADHAILYVQGEAFERDIDAISRAADTQADISAVMESAGDRAEVIEKLRILYLASNVDPDSRTLDFFVTLPNQAQRDITLSDGHRFFAWRFRPGQRVQLQIPIETLADRLVLPMEAVAQEGAESYVFTPNGDRFERRPVHLEYRDQRWAVIANDGSLFAGESVAVSGAQQLQLALKNQSGGGIDPHAGHSH